MRRILFLLLLVAGTGWAKRLAGELATSYRRPGYEATKVALLLSLAKSFAAIVNPRNEKDFNVLDIDQDGLVSYIEYSRDAPDSAHHSFLFSQADVDDNGYLNLAEYDFLKYIEVYEKITFEARAARIAERLPLGFAQELGRAISHLRETVVDGKTRLKDVAVVLAPLMLTTGLGPGEVVAVMHNLFEQADIITDGVLNLNELDYFHFKARDVLAWISMQRLNWSGAYVDADVLPIAAIIFPECDRNKDARLDVDELADHFAAYLHPGDDRKLFRRVLSTALETADLDRDGALSREEMPAFLMLILGMQPVYL